MKTCVKFYTLSVNEKYKHQTSIVNLSSFNASGEDFFDVVKKYFDNLPLFLKSQKTVKLKSKKQKDVSFLLEKLIVDDKERYISGIIWSGNSGYSSSMIDGDTLKTEFERKITTTEVVPLYFLFSLPKDKKVGLLALQGLGKHSLAQHLCPSLKEHFNILYNTLNLKIKPLMLGDLFINDYLTEGKLKSIEFIRHIAPRDRATGWQKKQAKCSFSITPLNRMSYLPSQISELIHSINKPNIAKNEIVKTVSSFYEIDLEDGFTDINFYVNHDGKRRRLNIDEFIDCASSYDITDEVAITDGGHPEFNAVEKWVKGMIKGSINKIIKD